MADPRPPGAPSELLALAWGETLAGTQDPTADRLNGSPPPPSDQGSPTKIGRYVVLRQIGAGGMGVVYSAYDPDLDRKVAIKLVRDDQQQGSFGRARILREAQALAQVSDSHVVHVYEVGESDGRVFIAMEFVGGGSLSTWLTTKGRAAPVSEILHIYRKAGNGLLAAHRLGIVHRDFKPDNVLFAEDGRVVVVDFGLARPVDGVEPGVVVDSPQAAGSQRLGKLPKLTQLGMILGTPGYMSPEQIRGDASDARSDQWSFCVALYEALYKQLPFAGDTFDDFAHNVLAGTQRPLPKETPHVPIIVARAIQRGLSLDASKRFPSMQELLDILRTGESAESETAASRAVAKKLGFSQLVVLGSVLTLMGWQGGRLPSQDMASLVRVGALVVTMFGLTSLLLHRQISSHPPYARLRFVILVVSGYMLLGRMLGFRAGLLPSQYLTIEMVGIGALMVLASRLVGRITLPLAFLSLTAAVTLQLWPAAQNYILGSYFPLLAIGSVIVTRWRGSVQPGQGIG